MKGNSLMVGMAFLLAVMSLGVAAFAFQYVQLTRSLNASQFTLTQVEFRQNRLKAMVSDAVEYSQRNPAIDPLLISIGAKAAAPQKAAPAKPAGR